MSVSLEWGPVGAAALSERCPVLVVIDVPLGADAEVAVAAYHRWSVDRLLACRSGVELVDRGFGDDVRVAAEEDADDVVPVLVDEAFLGA